MLENIRAGHKFWTSDEQSSLLLQMVHYTLKAFFHSRSTVVQHLTPNAKLEGSNPAPGTEKEKNGKKSFKNFVLDLWLKLFSQSCFNLEPALQTLFMVTIK